MNTFQSKGLNNYHQVEEQLILTYVRVSKGLSLCVFLSHLRLVLCSTQHMNSKHFSYVLK